MDPAFWDNHRTTTGQARGQQEHSGLPAACTWNTASGILSRTLLASAHTMALQRWKGELLGRLESPSSPLGLPFFKMGDPFARGLSPSWIIIRFCLVFILAWPSP
jgi:hypothetical protein